MNIRATKITHITKNTKKTDEEEKSTRKHYLEVFQCVIIVAELLKGLRNVRKRFPEFFIDFNGAAVRHDGFARLTHCVQTETQMIQGQLRGGLPKKITLLERKKENDNLKIKIIVSK